IRTERPTPPPFDPDCPFCPGNEDRTPPEIHRRPLEGPWQWRLIPNMYPAVAREGTTERHGQEMTLEMDAVGAHEVLIESPTHSERLDEMDLDRLGSRVRLWRDRSREIAAEPWARAVSVFRNFGRKAGTSIEHPHSQIIATPVTPPELRRRVDVAERYWDEYGRSVYADLLEGELDRGLRLVAVRDDFAAIAPFASRFPFETWILPRDHTASFTQLADGQIPGLAGLLRDVLRGLRDAAGDPDLNLAIRSAPVGDEGKRSYVWHLGIFPRLTIPAGFELGAGMAINPMPPERAAERLRTCQAIAAG
ncbi:MAG: galactose-1-phosphate uridylyltransferase, partial [Actinomycetota bacterium]|nr:galactose-1-phosphate uridylyltransferase [Actinomycetota bacterium]